MKLLRRGDRALLAGVLLAGIIGCSSPRANVYLADGFDEQTLRAAPIGLLGITALAGPDDTDSRIGYRERAHAVMQKERRDLRWVEPSTLWIGLGVEETHAILDTYRSTARLGPTEIEALSVLRDRVRYLMIARIDLDLVTYDYERQEREIAGRWRVEVEPRARRELAATFDLFDLERGLLVYSGQIQKVESLRGDLLESEMLEDRPLEADFERRARELMTEESLPEPPSRVAVLSLLARAAAESLPGTEKAR